MGTRIEGTNTIFFISKSKVPSGRTVTYGSLVSTIRPHKEEKFRTCVTVGGDKLPYPGPTYTKTASMTTIKIIFNSTISTPGACFMTLDLKCFYYFTPMIRFEYMKLPFAIIPDEIIAQYNLRTRGDVSTSKSTKTCQASNRQDSSLTTD